MFDVDEGIIFMRWIFVLVAAFFSLITCYLLPVCGFLNMVEDIGCELCVKRKRCFARKKINLLDSDYLSEWMLLSFFVVRKKCPCVKMNTRKEGIVYYIISFVLFFISFWSKGYEMTGFFYGIVAIMLLFLSVVDWNTQYIPFECNVFILLCGLIHLFADFSNWVDYIIGLLAVSGFLFMIDKVMTPVLRDKYEGEVEVDHVIGDGDIKLMAATGLLLGWKLNFLALGIGCIIGSIIHLILMKVKESEPRFAFGPYLSLGVYITMICGEQLISWYLNMWV